jgi:cobalamin transport system substrate-binding protein
MSRIEPPNEPTAAATAAATDAVAAARRRRRRVMPTLLVTVVVSSFVLSALGRQWVAGCPGTRGSAAGAQTTNAKRIVSLAPSITETLFTVGCGQRVAGATRYCNYPAAAKRIPRVGGYIDPSYERIAGLKPDLVVALRGPEHKRVRAYLQRMRLPLLTVDHESLGGIVASLEQLGRACGEPARGKQLAQQAQARLRRVAQNIRGRNRPRVLIVFGRATVAGPLKEVYVAGRKGLYDDVLRRAGGSNAFPRDVPAYPKLSAEGIAALDPDLIVELAPDLERQGVTHAQLLASWRTLPSLRAVRKGAVHILPGAYGEVPGPRFVDLVVHLSKLLHPVRAGKTQ